LNYKIRAKLYTFYNLLRSNLIKDNLKNLLIKILFILISLIVIIKRLLTINL